MTLAILRWTGLLASLVFTLSVWFASATCVHALAFEPPALRGRVNDNDHLLSAGEEAELDDKLRSYEKWTGHQFVLLTTPSLGELSIEEYAEKTFRAWRLGDKQRDDGVLYVICRSAHKHRVEVGYGLEGTITDLRAKELIESAGRLIQSGLYALAIDSMFDGLMKLALDEATEPQTSVGHEKSPALARDGHTETRTYVRQGESSSAGAVLFGLLLLFFGLVYCLSGGSRYRGRGGHPRDHGDGRSGADGAGRAYGGGGGYGAAGGGYAGGGGHGGGGGYAGGGGSSGGGGASGSC